MIIRHPLLIGVLAAAVLTALVSAKPEKSTLPMAVLSLQKVLAQSNEARSAARKIETTRQERGRQAAELEKKLEATHQQLVEAGGVFKTSRRAALKAEEDRERADLQGFTQRSQTELLELQHRAQAALQRSMTSAVQAIAERRSFQVVFNGDQAIIWAPGTVDVTSEVIEMMNSGYHEPEAPK